MNGLRWMNSTSVYIEIGQSWLKALYGESGLELPLERADNGRLTGAYKEKLILALQNFLNRKSWQLRPHAFCAIGARGVSLRRLTLPAASKEEFQRLLLLQIESEFPLPPDELAWGFRPLGGQRQPDGATAKQELLVAAVKKEALEPYSEILSACGVTPVFTLAALARNSLCPQSTGLYAMLDVADTESELISFQEGAPAAVRVLRWGSENLRSDATAGIALDSLAKAVNGYASVRKIYLTGNADKDFAAKLARQLGNGVDCERLELPSGEGRSAAILGLKKSAEADGGDSLLTLQLKQINGGASLARPAPWKWAALAAALAVGALAFPFAEAILFKPHLARKFAAFQAGTNRLATIDRELDFLQYLKLNQPPYLDALYLFAKAAPPGARIELLTMNRRGEIALRGSMKNSEEVTGFRSKLIASGFFANVVVEEQVLTPDRQKVNVRITALWKPASGRQSLVIGPTAEEIEKAKTSASEAPPGLPPGMENVSPPPTRMPVSTPGRN